MGLYTNVTKRCDQLGLGDKGRLGGGACTPRLPQVTGERQADGGGEMGDAKETEARAGGRLNRCWQMAWIGGLLDTHGGEVTGER